MAPSCTQPPGSTPAQILAMTTKKRGREEIEKEYDYWRLKAEEAKKKIKPSASFDAAYWTAAAQASDYSHKMHEQKLHLALLDYRETELEEGNARGTKAWWTTPEAHKLVDQLKASNYERVRYHKQADQIRRGGPLRRSIQILFNTSKIGLGLDNIGVGKRSRSEQSKFKTSLIDYYDAAITDPKRPKKILYIHDTATGHDFLKSTITAAHLVPHSLGNDMLVALFGGNFEGELDTPNNGLLLHQIVKTAMDDGVIAIVPDIADNPSTEEVTLWDNSDLKDYKWKIIDPEAQILDEALEVNREDLANPMTIRDIENRKLSFKNSMRPRARYLYYLFALAHLKLAWRQEYRQDPKAVLEKQLVKGFWATKGRYLKRSFLLALANEIGHDTELAENVPIEPGDDTDPDDARVLSLAKLLQFPEDENEE
ncbi:hypothetical protein F4818DRAFT_455858 [Hypoxylon cercidicola]|nr:hypothetical protein F4818DRAFT_455858 [Hypoxylon cercidicola]